MNSPKAIKILALSSSPTDAGPLRLDIEIRGIKEELERAQYRDRFEFISEVAVRVDDLSQAILKHKPDIVHFSGHGVGEEGLVLENENGKAQFISTEALSRLFKWGRNIVKCVFLNACFSQVQAEAIHQNIGCVIGMNKAIGDRAAIKFAAKFYQALLIGESFQSSYEFACTALDLSGNNESSTPELLNRIEENDPLGVMEPVSKEVPSQLVEPSNPPLASQSIGDVANNDAVFGVVQASGHAAISQNNAPQTINMSDNQISGQFGIAGRDLNQTQINNSGDTAKTLSTEEVVMLLAQIEKLFTDSTLPDSQKNKIINHIESIKEEAETEKPDKQYATKSLQKIVDTLKTTNEAVVAGESLWEKVSPMLKHLLPWLGVATKALVIL